MTSYKIGTRGSLLAVTQSTLVKNELEALSGEKFELVTIKTQGDEITSKPLWQLEGKDFFTKELDEALLKGEVDLVIHSYKDLGSVRPEGIKLAAVTERRFAQDILLISRETIARLRHHQGAFVVGTSSPRRMANLTRSLKDYLPFGEKLDLRCESLRGNVNTRIKRLIDGNYHAIVLALAGIERLAAGETSRIELAGLLKGLDYFILPQSAFPSAASQGALGIETLASRGDGGKLESIIGKLTHATTVEEVRREREAFKGYGGGCHLAVGIHARKIGDLFLHVHSGEVDGKRIEVKTLEGRSPVPSLAQKKKLFIGLPTGKEAAVYDEYVAKKPMMPALSAEGKHVFVTSRYCLPALLQASVRPAGVWAAGTRTARELARAGVWVNGSADSLGTADLVALKNSRALAMFGASIQENWITLSHPEARSDLGPVLGCYTRETQEVSAEFERRLSEVGACYWTSFPQYALYLARFPFIKDAVHCCGLGKTWQEFTQAGVSVQPMASMQEFYALAEGSV
jgi:hydroxymethylbilane synthase